MESGPYNIQYESPEKERNLVALLKELDDVKWNVVGLCVVWKRSEAYIILPKVFHYKGLTEGKILELNS